jgi:hypothetical protein
MDTGRASIRRVDATRSLPEALTPEQVQVVAHPRRGGTTLCLNGMPGTGKTTALMARLAALLKEGVRPHEIMVLVPQRAQVEEYERLLSGLDAPTRGGVDVTTFYSLVQRVVALFWPVVAGEAGFASPDREPTFLTIETAQYFMWRVVEPLVTNQGYFRDLAIRRGRLLAQIIDNLNKSALVGFDHTEIYPRLSGAWTGTAERANSYWQAQDCAMRFRQYCLAHNLVDFSLMVELFHRHLMPGEAFRDYFRSRYRHLLVDNLEENVPVALDWLRWASEQCEATVLAFDVGGGYRLFLGADVKAAEELGDCCDLTLAFAQLTESTADALALAGAIRRALGLPEVTPESLGMGPLLSAGEQPGDPRQAIADQGGGRYWVSMVNWIIERVVALMEAGTPAGEIAIIAPYVSEVMRFAIEDGLRQHDIAIYLLRPSGMMRDDPVVRALLVLLLLAHPDWQIEVGAEPYALSEADVALALEVALGGLDPIRARHLAQAAVPVGERTLADLSGEDQGLRGQRAIGRLWEQVGYQVRERYQRLWEWFEGYRQGEPEPVDIMLSRLFGDLLSRRGYGFYDDVERGRAYGRLVESAFKFGQAVGPDLALARADRSLANQVDESLTEQQMWCDYVQLLLGGITTAQYLLDWPESDGNAVILATAYGYLTRDLRSTYQFWTALGDGGWLSRPNQPLTHPYVLRRDWPVGQPWSDVEDLEANREALGRVIQGLAARCTGKVYLAYSELGIGGEEQNGELLHALLRALTVASHA